VKLDIPFKDRNYQSTRRINNILQQDGYESKVVWLGGRSTRAWVKK